MAADFTTGKPSDVFDSGNSSKAVEIIVSILRTSPAFSERIHAWALNIPAVFFTNISEPLWSRWWEQNKVHFDTKRYDLVKPPQE